MLVGAEQDEIGWYDQTWAATLVSRAWERLQESYAGVGEAEWLAEVAPTVPNSADIEDELHYLYRVLMS